MLALLASVAPLVFLGVLGVAPSAMLDYRCCSGFHSLTSFVPKIDIKPMNIRYHY